MVSEELSVLITYIEVIALSLPVIAIFLQAMVNFEQNMEQDWRSETDGVHRVLMEKRYSFVFYAIMALYVVLLLIIYVVYVEMGRPSLLQIPTYGIAIAFALLFIGISGFFWKIETFL